MLALNLVVVSLIFLIVNFFVDLLVDLLDAAIGPGLRFDRARLGTAGG